MGPQRDDKVVDASRSVIGCQDDDFVGPVVLLGAPVATVLAHLPPKQETEMMEGILPMTSSIVHPT